MNKRFAAALLLVFFALPAFASAPDFMEIDKDKDGAISQDEAIEAGINDQLFAKLDVDKDNKLSIAEYNVLTEGRS